MRDSQSLWVTILIVIGAISLSGVASGQQTTVPTNFGGIVTNQLVAPSITNSNLSKVSCSGTSTYTYQVVASDATGGTTSTNGSASTTTGCLSLSASSYITVSTPTVSGAAGCYIYRTVAPSGLATGKIGAVPCGQIFSDLGIAGDGTSPPSSNSTGSVQTVSAGVFQLSTDTGISRDSAGVFDFGNGSQGSKAGTINAQAFNASGTGAGTMILTNGNPLSACGSPPCISSSGEFFVEAPMSITSSWGIVVPATGPPATEAALFSSSTGSPSTSTMSFIALSNQSGAELQTATGTLTSGDLPAWNSSGDLVDSGIRGSGGFLQSTNTIRVTGGNFSVSNTTTLTAITGLAWTLPATSSAATYSFSCHFTWESSGSTAAGLNLGIGISAAPSTAVDATADITYQIGTTSNRLGTIGFKSNATVGAQSVNQSGPAAASATAYDASLFGTIEGAPTAGSTFTIYAAPSTGSNTTIVITRGTFCQLY